MGSIVSAGEGNRNAARDAKCAAQLILDGWQRERKVGKPMLSVSSVVRGRSISKKADSAPSLLVRAGDVSFWHLASFCDNGALRSLSERSGRHRPGFASTRPEQTSTLTQPCPPMRRAASWLGWGLKAPRTNPRLFLSQGKAIGLPKP
jgi:hypothetical protein